MQNPATQAPILTKPGRWKLQAMEIGLDVWFLAATPVEERSNNAKPSNRGADSDQTQVAKASGDGNQIWRVVSRRRSNGGEEHVGVESGFDLFWIWFVNGFLGLGSGEWDDILRK